MTNADKLNNMSNAELFLILATKDKCDYCSYWGKGCVKGINCALGIRKWMESEVDSSGILR